MTDLNQVFRDRIQQNPGDKLTLQIYADWLEEQGSFKAEQVRNYLEGKPLSTDLSTLLAAMRPEVLNSCLYEFLERAMPVFEDAFPDAPPLREMLVAAQSGGDLRELLLSVRTIHRDIDPRQSAAWLLVRAVGLFLDYQTGGVLSRLLSNPAKVVAADVANALGGNEPRQQLLIASKYLLFY